MYIAELKKSSYPNCIKYHELDVALGCNVQCIYCGLATQKNHVQKVDVQNLLDKLPEDVKGIYLSPNTDAFAQISKESTHQILEYYLPKGMKFLLITKNTIPLKTINLLSQYSEQVTVKVSLARLDQDLINYIEPGSASAIDRLKTMRQLTDAGIKVQALLMPMYPEIDDQEEKIIELINRIREAGVKLIKSSYVIIRNGIKDKDIEMINKMLDHPILKKSWELMTEMQTAQIGCGQIYPFDKRVIFYSMLSKICKERDMTFSACTVLDPALKEMSTDDFFICKDLKFLPDFLK